MSYSDQLRECGLAVELVGASLIVSPANLVTEEIAELIRTHKQSIVAEISNAGQWTGDAAALVAWFRDNLDSLPLKPFTLVSEPNFEIIWLTPQASYRELLRAIDEGPGGSDAESLVSILALLRARFPRNGREAGSKQSGPCCMNPPGNN